MISIRSSPLILGQLCALLAEGCNLRKLALVAAGLTDSNIEELCKIVQSARFLIELDIRRNKISAQKMPEFARVLAANRQLQIINLSWNSFVQSEAKGLTPYDPADDLMMQAAEA